MDAEQRQTLRNKIRLGVERFIKGIQPGPQITGNWALRDAASDHFDCNPGSKLIKPRLKQRLRS